jgi:hypothetical protein
MYKREFSKYEHNKQRPSRFEETREYHLAEQWFKERRSVIKAPVTETCEKCFLSTDNPIKMGCCKSTFCSECYSDRADLYNRCNTCNTVIDMTKYDLYDGFELKIPTYDEFCYYEPDQTLLQLEPLLVEEDLYVGQLEEQEQEQVANACNSYAYKLYLAIEILKSHSLPHYNQTLPTLPHNHPLPLPFDLLSPQ